MAAAAIITPLGVALVPFGPWVSLLGIELSWWLVIFGISVGLTGLALYMFGQPKPFVTLNGSEAFHVQQVKMFFPNAPDRDGFPLDVLFMRIINRSRWPSSRNAKARVSAHFRIEGEGADHLPSLDARWSDTQQPQPGDPPERTVDLEIDAGRQIVLVVKEPTRAGCYLFSNDSYNFPQKRGQRPEWRMDPGRYIARVRVSGENVSKHFACAFENHGASRSLEVHSIWEE